MSIVSDCSENLAPRLSCENSFWQKPEATCFFRSSGPLFGSVQIFQGGGALCFWDRPLQVLTENVFQPLQMQVCFDVKNVEM